MQQATTRQGVNPLEWIENMTDANFAKLVKLRDSDQTVAARENDIRGRRVVDKDRQPLGKVDALLVDEKENKVRFLEVASGGFLGLGEAKSFIPVDAIMKITEDEVYISQSAEKVAGAPAYDPALVNQRHFYENTYGYYGVMPFWSPDYEYPTYSGEDPLAGKWYR
jgi:sporulation protein YlmC with PRC-barrel domain